MDELIIQLVRAFNRWMEGSRQKPGQRRTGAPGPHRSSAPPLPTHGTPQRSAGQQPVRPGVRAKTQGRPGQRSDKRTAARAVPPPIPTLSEATTSPPPPSIEQAAAIPAASSANKASQGVSAAALTRWLRPETLRSQFILTEVLQPPLALRDKQPYDR